MSSRPPKPLEVRVHFEANRLASAFLADAYEQLVPGRQVRKLPATKSLQSEGTTKLFRRRKSV